MKFLVKWIVFDTDEDLTDNERTDLVDDNLGYWDADDEDDLIEEITSASGWCISSIDYEHVLS
jgi:hypothetical protein